MILLGRGCQMLEIRRETWEQHLAQAAHHGEARLSFMSQDHHRVRTFVVREMPGLGKPIEPGHIAQAVQLPMERVGAILDELEKKLFFLVRNEGGAVSWAYPVTVEPTPHALRFDSGERLYGA